MEEKILTRTIVYELGLNNKSVITADMLDGYTSIGNYAFSGCGSLTSVTIPNSVTSIGERTFYGCSSLTSINVVNDNPNYSSKDGVLFNKQQTTLIQCPGGKQSAYVIPNSVTSIGGSAFKDCSSLTNVTIGNSVTSIGESAFSGCVCLTSVTIPNSVTSIGDWAFSYCCSLTSVTIPNSVTSIRTAAFYDCSSLTSVAIGNNVTSIGNKVFRKCNFNCLERYDEQGRLIAYKGFKEDMTCRGFKYKEGETYEIEGEPILCEHGFHACLNPMDCFGYYCGQIGKDAVFHEVYLDGVSDEKGVDSKVVARKITIGREIGLSEMADIVSGRR